MPKVGGFWFNCFPCLFIFIKCLTDSPLDPISWALAIILLLFQSTAATHHSALTVSCLAEALCISASLSFLCVQHNMEWRWNYEYFTFPDAPIKIHRIHWFWSKVLVSVSHSLSIFIKQPLRTFYFARVRTSSANVTQINSFLSHIMVKHYDCVVTHRMHRSSGILHFSI